MPQSETTTPEQAVIQAVTPEMFNAYAEWESPDLPEFPVKHAAFLGWVRTAFMAGFRSARLAQPLTEPQRLGQEKWDHRYRRLDEGETILETDEVQKDDGSWVAAVCVGQKAPDPNYTSHRQYRRLKSATMAAWPEYDTDIPDALDAYSKECSEVVGRFGITERMSATFRWHEAWDRVRQVIEARPGVSHPDTRDAERWRAFLSQARVRMFGSAGVDPKTGERTDDGWVHFGAEFWSIYPYHEVPADDPTMVWFRHVVTALADDVIARRAAEKSKRQAPQSGLNPNLGVARQSGEF